MRQKIFLLIFCSLSITLTSFFAKADEPNNLVAFCSSDFISQYNHLIKSRTILADAPKSQKIQKAQLLIEDCDDFYAANPTPTKCQAEVGGEITEISSEEHLLMCGLVKASL
jgi:hypothetical protein